jgi:hypothetical protein
MRDGDERDVGCSPSRHFLPPEISVDHYAKEEISSKVELVII